MADFSNIYNTLKNLQRYIKHDVPEIIGTEAVNHFQESFQNEGFTDNSLKKWNKVKRRNSSSSWYGFKYGSKVRKPGRKQRRKGSITNFSPAATKRKILSGTGELRRSITYKKSGNRVIVYSDKDYAETQNKGGKIKIFGKSSRMLSKRQFIGKSRKLKRNIIKEINNDITKILK